jgi:hypothetical protein
MSKRELREMLVRLLPYVKGKKQKTALFVVALLLLTTHTFDAPHLHIESAPIQPTTIVTIAAMATASAVRLNSLMDSVAKTTADVPIVNWPNGIQMGYKKSVSH